MHMDSYGCVTNADPCRMHTDGITYDILPIHCLLVAHASYVIHGMGPCLGSSHGHGQSMTLNWESTGNHLVIHNR